MSDLNVKLRWALAASLGLNLFFAGYLVARPSERPRPESGAQARKLGPDLRRVFREKREVLMPLRKNVRDAHRRAREELQNEAFDETRLTESLRALRAARNELAEHMHGLVVEIAPGVPAAERPRLLGPDPGRRRREK